MLGFSSPVVETNTAHPAPNHDTWNTLLQKHVTNDGRVDYAGFQKDMVMLDRYLMVLAKNPVEKSWTRQEKMAYWINAYNAFTVKLIADNYPVKSILDLHGGKAWDVKWIKLGDKTYSLNNIENDILRPRYKDARIHFAVNCAAKSCPPIKNTAWTAANLERDLDKQTRAFVNNAKFNTITTKKASVSKIFEWYAVDFGKDLKAYLNKYSTTQLGKKAKVNYVEYDWALNKQ